MSGIDKWSAIAELQQRLSHLIANKATKRLKWMEENGIRHSTWGSTMKRIFVSTYSENVEKSEDVAGLRCSAVFRCGDVLSPSPTFPLSAFPEGASIEMEKPINVQSNNEETIRFIWITFIVLMNSNSVPLFLSKHYFSLVKEKKNQ